MELGTPATKVSWAHRTPNRTPGELLQDESQSSGNHTLRGGMNNNRDLELGRWRMPLRCKALRTRHTPAMLWNLYQLHLAIAPPVEHIQLADRIAKYQEVPVPKLSVLDGFFDRHGLDGNGFGAGNNMRFDDRCI